MTINPKRKPRYFYLNTSKCDEMLNNEQVLKYSSSNILSESEELWEKKC